MAALVALAAQARELVEADQEPHARALREEADLLWAELHRCVAAPEEHALWMLQELDATDLTGVVEARQRLCQRLLAEGLAQRWRGFQSSRNREAVDALVRAMLTAVPRNLVLAQMLAPGLLVDQPYLGLAHEQQVLDLVTESVAREGLRGIAAHLLLTLWTNLIHEGARSSEDLAGLALVFQSDPNPTRRLAALQHLLLAREGRYREFVLQQVSQSRDRALATEVALAAARSLDPGIAVECLRRLNPIAGEGALGAFLLLAERDPGSLARAYEHQLTLGTEPGLRAAMVSAAGFDRETTGWAVAQLAFAQDPDPEVRIQALLALTACAPGALGEPTLHQALDDPRLSGTATRIGQITLGLENLASAGETNAVDRVARRLLARPDLPEAHRLRIQELMARSLPQPQAIASPRSRQRQ